MERKRASLRAFKKNREERAIYLKAGMFVGVEVFAYVLLCKGSVTRACVFCTSAFGQVVYATYGVCSVHYS